MAKLNLWILMFHSRYFIFHFIALLVCTVTLWQKRFIQPNWGRFLKLKMIINIYPNPGISDQFRGMKIVAVKRRTAWISVSSRTRTQWLRKIKPYVNCITNLLHRTFG